MDMSRQITQQCKKDVDTQINSTTRDQKHSKRRNENLYTLEE